MLINVGKESKGGTAMTKYMRRIRLWRAGRLTKLLALILGAPLVLISFWQNFHALINKHTPASLEIPSLDLGQYQLTGNPVELPYISKNASGLTYNPDTNTLFAVINHPESIIEMDKNGHLLRAISLGGFEDTEGLVYIGNERFVILEERRRSIVMIPISADTVHIDRRGLRSLALPISGEANKGFEGIAADVASGRLFVVNEKKPRQLLQIDGFINYLPTTELSEPWNLEDNSLGNSDIAGLHFDAQTGHLLLLSEESGKLSESDLRGTRHSQLNFGSLDRRIPQAEGVTLDDEGNLFILSEPNLFFRLAKSG